MTDNRALWELVEKWREKERTSRGCGDFCDGVAHAYDMFADAIQAILERPVVVGGWLPIDSAPKDGTAILLASDHFTFFGENGPYAIWQGRWTEGDRVFHQLEDNWPLYDVTHWMPLPAAPETNESMVRGKS